MLSLELSEPFRAASFQKLWGWILLVQQNMQEAVIIIWLLAYIKLVILTCNSLVILVKLLRILNFTSCAEWLHFGYICPTVVEVFDISLNFFEMDFFDITTLLSETWNLLISWWIFRAEDNSKKTISLSYKLRESAIKKELWKFWCIIK